MSYRVALAEHPADTLAFGPFHVRFAVGLEPRLEEYRLRYDAFVEEHHWESPDGCPDRLERDQFDRYSCSALIVDATTGEPAACQRLWKASPMQPAASASFAARLACRPSIR